MKQTSKKSHTLTCFAIIIGLMTGCTKEDRIVEISSLNQRAYIASRFNPGSEISYNGGLDLSNLYIDGKKLVLGSNITANKGYLDRNFEIFLCTNYAAETVVSGTLSVADNAKTMVSSYNSSHKSDFQLLDANYYSITPDRATIEAGERSCDTPFNVVLHGNKEWSDGNYLLPLSCTLDDGSDVVMSENANIVWLKLNINGTKISYTDVFMVRNDEFTVNAANSSSGANALDEDNETAWVNESENEYIEVDFGAGIYLSRVCFVGLNSPMFVYLQTVEDDDFSLLENSFDSSYDPNIYVYDPKSNSEAPMDPTVRVKKVRLKFAGGTGHSLDDVYFLKVDESTIHSKMTFDINGEATQTVKYSDEPIFYFNGEALEHGLPNSTTEWDIRAKIDYSVLYPLSVSCGIASDAESAVRAYNTAHKTSCSLLPETFYTITGGDLNIAAGQRQSESAVHVQLVMEELDKVPSAGQYLLPLTCTLNAGDADVLLPEEAKTIFIQVDITGSGAVMIQEVRPSTYKLDIGTTLEETLFGIDNAFDSNRQTIFLSGSDENTTIYSSFEEPIDLKEIVLVSTKFLSNDYLFMFAAIIFLKFELEDGTILDSGVPILTDTNQDFVRLDVSQDVNGKKVKGVYTQINLKGTGSVYGCADIYYYATKESNR